MDAKERRKLMRTIGQLLDDSEEILDPNVKPPVRKIEGDGWRAWLYTPSPGQEQIHVELRLDALLEAAA